MKHKIRTTLFLVALSLADFGCISSNDPTPNPAPTKVYIYSVVASPTLQESITIKNNSGITQDLSNWKLGDSNDPNAYNIPNGTVLINGETKTFTGSTLGFGINDSGEVLYLKDSSGSVIDSWTN